MRRRYCVLCQQSTVLSAVAALGLSAVGVVELEVVPPSGKQAVAGAPAGAGGLSLVSAAPVEPTVRSVPLVDRATEARRDAERAGRTSGPLVVTSGAEEAPGYATVGVTWSGGQPLTEEDVEVAVRTRGTGDWTPWQEMHFDPDHGPEPAEDDAEARGGTDAVEVGDVRRVQARVTVLQGETPTGLELDIVDPGDERRAEYEAPAIDTASLDADGEPVDDGSATSATLSSAAVQTAGVTAPKPQIFSRSQWGADESLRDRGSLRYGDIDGGFVHHTVNANNYTQDQVPSLLRGIYAYHTRSLGWSDIGYNFLVDRFGRIWEGRYGGVARPVVGAHTLGYNEDSFAMSAIGNFETVQPSQVMLDAYAALFAWKLGLHGIRADDTDVTISGDRFQAISGHRDAGSTACPGRYLYAKLPEIRRATAALQGTEEQPAAPVKTTDRDADISGKRWPDLVARDARSGNAVVVRTGGQLSFVDSGVDAQDLSRSDLVAAAGDLDGDGSGDLVARTAGSGEAVLLRGDAATARLRSDRTYSAFGTLDQLTGVGDFDGDGNADLVGRNKKGALRLFPGKGNGAFAAPRTLASSWADYDLTVGAGDLDDDGHQDLLARAGSELFLVPGTGRGELGERVSVPGKWDRFDLLSGRGDATGDGVDDLVARVEATGLTYVYPGNGNGGLEPRLGGWADYASVRWLSLAGQLAGNPKPDLAVIGQNGGLRVQRHSGRTNLGGVVDTGIGLGAIDLLVNVGDWNDDGHG
ncbi:MAG: FG-GAP-like repeat-containing protein, partial [Nocardioides sp.]